MKYNCIILFSISLFVSAKGYIYELAIFCKWNKKQQQLQKVVCLGDFHYKKHKSTMKQRQYIYDLICTYKNKCKVVIEDLSSINNSGTFFCNGLYINSRGGLLGGLADDLHIKGVHTCNVEYRYARAMGICSLLHINDNYYKVLGKKIRMKDIYAEFEKELCLVQQCFTRKKIDIPYVHVIKQIETLSQRQQCFQNKNIDIISFYEQNKNRKKIDEIIQELATFDSVLLDMHILYEIISSYEPYIFVVAGGTHTHALTQYLLQNGYTQIYKSKKKRKNVAIEPTTSSIISSYHIKKLPPVVDIQAIEKFLK